MNLENNFLSPNEFVFTINRLPNLEFYIQSIDVPGISSGFVDRETPLKSIPVSGDKVIYDELVVTAIVDSKLNVYNEISEWIRGLTFPESQSQYARLLASDEGLYSDATLTILSSKRNPKIDLKFERLFPISIGSIPLNTTSSDVTPPTTSITFRYTTFSVDIRE